MASLSDSEDEADARPCFGHSEADTSLFFPEDETLPRNNRKRPYSGVTAGGDATVKESTPVPEDLDPEEFVKKKKTSVEMSVFARKMMEKMGHKEGEGLGKHGQGRTNIVEASTQRGRRGLGLVISGLEPSDVEWDFNKEEVLIDEEVLWLPPYQGAIPTLEELCTWMEVGPKKREIDDETDFCSEKVLKDVLNGKNVFDELEPEEMRRARTRSNPYETIRGAFFLNRAAMKMANMDAVLDFMFTDPKFANGKSMVGPKELLYFVDVCAGPGGFSEYVLWRKKGESKGFGLTLKGSYDFKLEDFFAGPPEMFEPHYGVGGLEGDGDIYRPDNQEEFVQFVKSNTDNKGVHFVMADGGFSVEGQENIQEVLSKQLYLCQFLVAVSTLRTGGHFVCKLFDLFTSFSVGLVYLMNMIFEQVSLFKPVTSRPANSERYIICKSLKAEKDSVQRYLHYINVELCHYMSAISQEDILHIVPLSTLMNDDPFFSYMVNSNESFAKLQVLHLKKIAIFTKNSELYEQRQSEVRTECLKKWKIPDEVRAAPGRPDPNSTFQQLIENSDRDIFETNLEHLTAESLKKIKCLSSYSCIVRGEGQSYYILGCGRSNVFKWDGQAKSKWVKLDGFRVELPHKTLLEVMSVTELRGEGKGQRRQTTIHVLDAFYLCGKNVTQLSFEERQEKLEKFVKAIRKTTRSDLTQLYMPDVFPLERMDQIFDRLSMKVVKGSANKPRLCYCTSGGNFFHPSGVSIVQTVKEPWIKGHSKSTGQDYWFHIHKRQSSYECPPDSIATVRDCKAHQVLWAWTEGVKVHPSQEKEDPCLLSRRHITEHIQRIRQA